MGGSCGAPRPDRSPFREGTIVQTLKSCLSALPLIAILRGIRTEEAVEIGTALVGVGFRIIEVPLNSPGALGSIAALGKTMGDDILIGAGTVLSCEQVEEVAAAGGRLIVSPNWDPSVIRAAKRLGLICVPGCATPTEILAALAEGADGVKVFPAEMISPAAVKAIRAVTPPQTLLLPVGGITLDNMMPFLDAGAAGFGLGSAIYRPGWQASDVAAQAAEFVVALRPGYRLT